MTAAVGPGVATRATRRYAAYVFDLDGTVHVDEVLTGGALRTLSWIRDIGSRVAFLTKNPLRPGRAYAAMLERLGIAAQPADVITSLDALVRYLRAHPPAGPVLLLAEPLVGDVLRDAGWALTTDPAAAAMVVVSWDRGFSYERLLAAFRAVRGGARIVATNPDPFCPTADGGLPDCAGMLAALEACTGAKAEAIVGKPSAHMAAAILDHLGTRPEDTLMVGDRLLTDVGLARTAGMTAALALTGATDLAALDGASIRPDLALSSLLDLIPPGDPLTPA